MKHAAALYGSVILLAMAGCTGNPAAKSDDKQSLVVVGTTALTGGHPGFGALPRHRGPCAAENRTSAKICQPGCRQAFAASKVPKFTKFKHPFGVDFAFTLRPQL